MSTELPPGVELEMPDGSKTKGKLSDSEWEYTPGPEEAGQAKQAAALSRIAKARMNGSSGRRAT